MESRYHLLVLDVLGRYCQTMAAKMPPQNIRLDKALWGAEWEL
jgi:hypothetical protein